MRIATWNVNSVKQRVPRLLPWLDERQPDVVCLQEIKLTDGQFLDLLSQLQEHNLFPICFTKTRQVFHLVLQVFFTTPHLR